jgi:hypothetical protein
MGNNIHVPKGIINSNDYFTSLDDEKIADLKNNYTIIEVDYLDPILVHSKMMNKQFSREKEKKSILAEMLKYYLQHNDKEIYKKTDYLCNETEKVCICNTHAEDFRRIYDGIHYKPNDKYISWFTPLKKI